MGAPGPKLDKGTWVWLQSKTKQEIADLNRKLNPKPAKPPAK